jgi:pSer/pThr/pTyr-binding forkhead associated (FHA) protein
MGKDAEGAYCDTCRLFGGDAPVVVEAPRAPLVAERAQIRITWRDRGVDHELVPTGDEIWVGRGKGNEIMLDSVMIGRRQCRFVLRDGHVIVEDNNSTCGTFLDGTRVDSAEVRNGSQVHIGNHLLRITSTRSR